MEKNFEFELESISSITIKTAWPQIEINTDAGNSIRLMITGDDGSVATLVVEEKDGNLNIEQPYFGINKSYLQGSWMQILLILPESYSKPLSVNSVSGSCIATGYHGEQLKFDFISGDIQLRDIATKKLRIKEVSGDITADTINADSVKIRGVSGKALFKALSTNTLASNYVSGAVSLYITNEFESMDFVSVSGNINIYQPYTALDVSVRSVSSSLVLQNVEQKDSAAKIGINAVTARITIGRNNN